jgi:hypothetical protein
MNSQEIQKYNEGQGCECFAPCEGECGCGADWTPKEVYVLRNKIADLEKQIKKTNLEDYRMSYSFLDGSAGTVRFLASYLEVLKEEDPIMHEKICSKQREIMKGIEPDSKKGPTVLSMISDVLQTADKDRFYQVMKSVSNAQEKPL